MKKFSLIITLLLTLAVVTTYSQDKPQKGEYQTIFGNKEGKVSHGGYAAITTSYSQVAGKDIFGIGGRAGWLIDHHVTIGIMGQGFVNSIYVDTYDFPTYPDEDPIDGLYLVGGYGGLFVEPIIAPNFPVHVAFPILIGGGAAAWNYYTWYDYGWKDGYYYDHYDPYDYDGFFVLQPGVEIELNLAKFMRASVGASYRYVADLQLDGTPKDALNGFTGNFSLKFGKF
jgi:hypothetical protein